MLVSSATPYSAYPRLGSALYFRTSRVTNATPAAAKNTTDLRELNSLTQRLRKAAELLGAAASTRRITTGTVAGPSFAQSANAFQISTEQTSAQLSSNAEINAVPTSFTPRTPGFEGASSADPLVDGVYDGSQGDDTLTFQAVSGGIVGITPVQLEVRDSNSQLIDTLTFGIGYAAGTEVTVNNGLTIALGSGTVTAGDRFDVEVSASVGSVVNTQNAFNGTGNANPNFDPGVSVGTGTFEVNGVQISVAASDSIDSVLTKINASAAGVTATFDTASEGLVLTQDTPGSTATVVVGNDTSGFLAATKLDSAIVQAGTDDERMLALGSVAAFAGITSGSFSINGVNLTVDVLADSLNDVIARIDAADAGANAEFDDAQRKFSIQSLTPSTLTLSDGTSGLFTALGVQPGTYAPSEEQVSSTVKFRDGRKLRRRFDDFGSALEDLLRKKFAEDVAPAAAIVKEQVRQAFAGAFGTDPDAKTFSSNGLRIDFRTESSDTFRLQLSTLRRAMERTPEDVYALLKRSGEGLLPRLDQAFDQLDDELAAFSTAAAGSLVDQSG